MTPSKKFKQECAKEVQDQGEDIVLKDLTSAWFNKANSRKYSYHFE